MVGGWTNQNADDSEYMDRAWKAVSSINDNASNNGPYHFIPIKVISAKTQVVAGVQHKFEVVVGQSTCKKGDTDPKTIKASNCQLKDDGSRAIYEVTLWEKPWENFEEYNVQKVRDVESNEQF
ncbi:unnamed protein product [Caenorhabditis auriculariae]|uniref:Cystatin domain-containing protein n=1 Tax=Caenorhabditis auriculariae TaxID=2777116 RepID=A0A8S1HT03_9PELO|nr:unnamed protein product [Caenorhabditis auriculariae]